MSGDDGWIGQMTWQDWIDRAALREQMTARLMNAPPAPGMCLCQMVELATSIRWEIEFAERLAKRNEQAV